MKVKVQVEKVDKQEVSQEENSKEHYHFNSVLSQLRQRFKNL